MTRLRAMLRRTVQRATDRVQRWRHPHARCAWVPGDGHANAILCWPDPDARCPAHGDRQCGPCHRNPAGCLGADPECGYYADTGMHWDTCANRIRAT